MALLDEKTLFNETPLAELLAESGGGLHDKYLVKGDILFDYTDIGFYLIPQTNRPDMNVIIEGEEQENIPTGNFIVALLENGGGYKSETGGLQYQKFYAARNNISRFNVFTWIRYYIQNQENDWGTWTNWRVCGDGSLENVKSPTDTDLNDITMTTTMFLQTQTSRQSSHWPTNSHQYFLTVYGDGVDAYQIAANITKGDMYSRTCDDGVWSSWKPMNERIYEDVDLSGAQRNIEIDWATSYEDILGVPLLVKASFVGTPNNTMNVNYFGSIPLKTYNLKGDSGQYTTIPDRWVRTGSYYKVVLEKDSSGNYFFVLQDYQLRNTKDGQYGLANIRISTSAPSGGSDGDIWLQY